MEALKSYLIIKQATRNFRVFPFFGEALEHAQKDTISKISWFSADGLISVLLERSKPSWLALEQIYNKIKGIVKPNQGFLSL